MDTSDFQLFTNKYGIYAAPPEFVDRPLIRDVFSKGLVHEPRTLEFIRSRAGTGDVVSAGSWICDFLPAIASVLVKDALLHTTEPQPRSFAASEMTVALNRLTNVHLHKVALGRAPSKAVLQLTDPKTDISEAAKAFIVEGARPGGKGTVEVDVVTLDGLIDADRDVSVIHFDLEGFEGEALLGARKLIERCKPIIILEWHTITEDWLNEQFRGCAYRKCGFFEKNTFFVSTA